jgi:alkylhydroperoxidase family enzyme
MGFLEVVTLRPGEVGPADVEVVLAAGVSREAVADALGVAFAFNLIDRVADALGFIVVSPEQFARGAERTIKRGYN